jgi:hypothetical protein
LRDGSKRKEGFEEEMKQKKERVQELEKKNKTVAELQSSESAKVVAAIRAAERKMKADTGKREAQEKVAAGTEDDEKKALEANAEAKKKLAELKKIEEASLKVHQDLIAERQAMPKEEQQATAQEEFSKLMGSIEKLGTAAVGDAVPKDVVQLLETMQQSAKTFQNGCGGQWLQWKSQPADFKANDDDIEIDDEEVAAEIDHEAAELAAKEAEEKAGEADKKTVRRRTLAKAIQEQSRLAVTKITNKRKADKEAEVKANTEAAKKKLSISAAGVDLGGASPSTTVASS